MSDINWKDGAVCYAYGKQQYSCSNLQNFLTASDFKLNEILNSDYLLVRELKVEQEYNNTVEVFALFGFKTVRNKNYFDIKGCEVLKVFHDRILPDVLLTVGCKRQLTYHQIIAIGKLKRMMLERERSKVDIFIDAVIDDAKNIGKVNKGFNESEIKSVLSNADVYSVENFPKLDLEEKPKRRNKSKQAYDILKSLDYEYDLVKQRWFKKEYI